MGIYTLNIDCDIQPISEFTANATSSIQRLKSNRKPLVLTQNGKKSAVLLDVEDYENLHNTASLLRDITNAREELKNGEGLSYQE